MPTDDARAVCAVLQRQGRRAADGAVSGGGLAQVGEALNQAGILFSFYLSPICTCALFSDPPPSLPHPTRRRSQLRSTPPAQQLRCSEGHLRCQPPFLFLLPPLSPLLSFAHRSLRSLRSLINVSSLRRPRASRALRVHVRTLRVQRRVVRCSNSLRSLEHLTRLAGLASLRSSRRVRCTRLQDANSANAPRKWMQPAAKCARARCAHATTTTLSNFQRSTPIFVWTSTFIL